MKSIFRIIDITGNLIIINMLFILTTILTLGIGFGSSLSALCATYLELRTDDSGYYVRNYFRNFKRNFSVSTKVWIIIVMFIIASYLNILIINTISSIEIKFILYSIVGAFILEIAFISVYVFTIIAKFEVNTFKSIKIALYYAHKYIHYTFIFVILWFMSIILPLFISFAFIFIIFALVVRIQTRLFMNIWRSMYAKEKIS